MDNYYNDPRVMAGNYSKWYKEIDEAKMLALFEDDEGETWVPFEYTVCPTCDGKGTHVNPSIDCDGISGETFAEDPEFFEEYRSGVYDVPCYECNGKRVIPTTENERVDEWRDREVEYQSICAAERKMGA